MKILVFTCLALLFSCGPSSRKDCEEYCRYSSDVGPCVDRCRGDGGEREEPCDPDQEICPPTADE